ncbi:MAG: AraC family transcriptional regulator, partial [Akkermansiaceae bacterium]|nr:AraC family transcriptional regulator [Akkermansiaceae bacterium]
MRGTSGKRLPSSAATPDAVAGSPTTALCHQKHCADCARHALARDIGEYFKELTGLQIHLLRGTHPAAVCPEFERLRGGNGTIPRRCALCNETTWQDAAREKTDGRVFAGACGRLSCRLSISAADGCALSLVIQTPEPPAVATYPSGGASAPGEERIGQAATLLKIVACGLEALLEAEELKRALIEAQRVWQAVLAGDNRLRQALGKRLPELLGQTVGPEITPQADRLVERVRDFLLHNFQRPVIGLEEAAASVHRSASYISALFARATGMSFHRYLQELRLTKARELLRDPCLTVAEVAQASGYASADWFR